MSSNFAFLSSEWPALHDDAAATEANIFTAPRTSEFYARRTMEKMVKWMFAHDNYLEMTCQDNLAAMIHAPTFKDSLKTRQLTSATDLENRQLRGTQRDEDQHDGRAELHQMPAQSLRRSPAFRLPEIIKRGHD